MLRKQTLVVHGDVYFIERPHSFGGDPPGHVAKSHVLYCPRCHTQWAVLYFDDDEDFWPVGQFCEECGVKDDWCPVPGSCLVEEGFGIIDEGLLAALPSALLRREFELTLKAYS